MTRREALALMLQALFPWLRTERGLAAAEEAAESLVALDYGAWETQAYWHLVRGYNMVWQRGG